MKPRAYFSGEWASRMERQRALCQVKNCCAAICPRKHCRQIESRGGLLLNARWKRFCPTEGKGKEGGGGGRSISVRMRESILQRRITWYFYHLYKWLIIDTIRENNNVTKKCIDEYGSTILVEHLTDWLASEIIYTIDRIVRVINNDPLPYSRNCLQLIMQ